MDYQIIPKKVVIPKKLSLDYLVKKALDGFEKHGDVYKLVLPVPLRIFCLRNPDHIKAVATNKDCGVVKPPGLIPKADYFMGNGIYNDLGDTPSWNDKRREINPVFAQANSVILLEDFAQAFDRMKARWQGFGSSPFELYYELQRLVLDFSAQSLFSRRLTDQELDWVVPDTMFAEVVFTTLTPWWIPTPENIKFTKVRNRFRTLWSDIISTRRQNDVLNTDLLHYLLKSKDPTTGEFRTDEEIRSAMFSVFFGASAVTLTILWGVYFASTRKEVGSQIRSELEKVLGNHELKVENLESLKYLENVVTEVLRLYPSFWGSMRYSKKPLNIDGYSFPKKSIFVMVRRSAHRHPDFWSKPNEFDPGRHAVEVKCPHASLPFGLGARICSGRSLAKMLAPMAIGQIMQKFSLEFVSEKEDYPTVKYGFGIYPARGIFVRAKPADI